jgi:hypothetical protein
MPKRPTISELVAKYAQSGMPVRPYKDGEHAPENPKLWRKAGSYALWWDGREGTFIIGPREPEAGLFGQSPAEEGEA